MATDMSIEESFAEACKRFEGSALRGQPTIEDRAALARVRFSAVVPAAAASAPIEPDTDEWRQMARDFRSSPLPVQDNFLARLGRRISVGRISY